MKQLFVRQEHSSLLTIFFSGWATDENLFQDVHHDNDMMVCFDYRSLSFDFSLLENYSKIKIVAWSMGVAIAEEIKSSIQLPTESTAINGTLYPVDDSKGIPIKIYQGTLEHLNEDNLLKFYRRMCKSSHDFHNFLEKKTSLKVEELKEELFILQQKFINSSSSQVKTVWDYCYIGKKDLIFPYINQKNAWSHSKVKNIVEIDAAHYSEELIKKVLQNG